MEDRWSGPRETTAERSGSAPYSRT